MFALVDCNNFYASCERVFHPEWKNRPIIVLSNNDGCVIARSNESKALGIPMGAPLFQCKNLIEAHDIIVCSSNYTLYGDMSERVMKTLKEFAIDFQVYSIDEAFLNIECENYEEYGRQIRETVLKWTGIPVSVGIAPTKTLAKVANHKAKKEPENNGVFVLNTPEKIEHALDKFPIHDVWGIGRKWSLKLSKLGVQTAAQFKDLPDEIIKKHLTVIGLRSALELRGISCLQLEERPPAKKSVTCSRAFGKPVDCLEQLQEAVSTYAARAGEKIRSQNSLATTMLVFVELHPFNRSGSNFFHIRVTFPQPTDFSPHLIHYARQAAEILYKPSQKYRKAGIILDGLVPHNTFQTDLFAPPAKHHGKERRLMKLVDQLNEKYGHNIIRSAAEGTTKEWKMKRGRCTPHYTTQWDEILTIRI